MKKQILLISSILIFFQFCSKFDSDQHKEPRIFQEDLLGKYCGWSTWLFYVESVNEDTLLLKEYYSGNFQFYIKDDSLIIPSQIIQHIHHSPGGNWNYYDVPCYGGYGFYHFEDNSLIFYVDYNNDSTRTIIKLRKFENVPIAGRYVSMENPRDTLFVQKEGLNDSLKFEFHFPKNDYGDSVFAVSSFQKSCQFIGRTDLTDTTYLYAVFEFPEDEISGYIMKWIRPKDSLDFNSHYTYFFNGKFFTE